MEIRQAIHCQKVYTDETVCEECELYSECTHETKADIARLAIAALEKQIPKKAKQGEPYTWIDSVRVKGRYRDVRKTSYRHVCPNCGENVAMDMSCCKYCGQAIDWSE